MEYKFLCKTDQIILLSSSSVILITKELLSNDIWLFIGFISFFICWLGWEYCWSIGYSPQSYNYHKRAMIRQLSEVTNNITLHSLVLAISDVSISLYIFSLTSYIIPNGLQSFDINYILLLVFFGLLQNKIITLIQISPVTSNMSWAPLAPNSDCKNSISCWNNQQEWFYATLIMYFCVIYYNKNV